MIKKCLICDKEFKTNITKIKDGRGKFCSRECVWKNLKGKPAWNKGKKTGIIPKTAFKKGHSAPKTAFKKGFTPWNKGKKSNQVSWNKGFKRPEISNENHFAWKGDSVGYHNLHTWVKRKLGKPKECLACKKIGKYIDRENGTKRWNIDFANKYHKYKRNLTDWIPLCQKCHGEYDVRLDLRKHNMQKHKTQKT